MEEAKWDSIEWDDTRGQAMIRGRRIAVHQIISIKRMMERWRSHSPTDFGAVTRFLQITPDQVADIFAYYEVQKLSIDAQIVTTHGPGAMKTIVVAHGKPLVLRLIENNLTRAGYQVLTTSDGEKALELIRSVCPDMVIVDAFMFPISGFDLLPKLHEGLPTTCSIMIFEGPQDDEFAFTVMRASPDASLQEPFNPMALLALVKRIFKSIDLGGVEEFSS